MTANSSGTKTAELRYKAWGETRYTSGTTLTTFKYTGQREESSFGLYYYGARWYDPSLNRWTQPDTIVPLATQGVQAWDRYCFVSNNPLRFVDPTGKYGVDVHYYMTYNLVYTQVSRIGAERGWSETQIKQVASSMAETVAQANESVDRKRLVHGDEGDYTESIGDPVGNWVDSRINDFENSPHKMELSDALGLVENSKDLESFGKAVHSLQDFYSHRMKPWLLYSPAPWVAVNHNDKYDEYGFPVNTAAQFGPGDDWYDFVDTMMYDMTREQIDQYLETINWDYWEKYFPSTSKAEKEQE